MPLKTVLRIAILVEIVLGVLAAGLGLALETRLPESLQTYLAAESASWSMADNIMLIAGIPTLIATIVSWIGLWRLWPPARSLYLYAWLAGLLVTAFTGPTVSSAVAYTIGDASVLAAGFILSLIYFSDLRHAFERGQIIRPIDQAD